MYFIKCFVFVCFLIKADFLLKVRHILFQMFSLSQRRGLYCFYNPINRFRCITNERIMEKWNTVTISRKERNLTCCFI